MTIQRDWVTILKKGRTDAFSVDCPSKPYVAFIDGQIKLMCGAYIRTWKQYFMTQFVGSIENAFTTGAEVVVMGFDDYTFVPAAKNMTQLSRMRSVPVMTCNEHDELPKTIPDNWSECIKNRSFKMKVIKFVIRNMHRHFADETNRTIIIDWQGAPDVIGKKVTMPTVFESGDNLKRGECDIKAFAWMEMGPTLLISTDGDYVPLALAQIETQKVLHPVYIYRMLCRVNGIGKRKSDGSMKREYEYVDMQKILNYVQSEFPKSEFPARSFCGMVALTGCDFSMKLPAVGPIKVWNSRHLARHQDVTTVAGLMTFVLRIYNSVYQKHICTINKDLQANFITDENATILYDRLNSSMTKSTTIANRTRDAFWKTPRMIAHVKNSLWTISYWTEIHNFPEPLSGDHGFEKRKNIVAFVGC